MRLCFTPRGWDDYLYWQRPAQAPHRRRPRRRGATLREPFSGIGKPEALRHVLAGCWSRRVDDEHRFVYLVDGDDLVVLQARYHYGD
jgi:toxin YoeB